MKTDPQGEGFRDDRGRVWRDAWLRAGSQETLRLNSHHQQLEEARMDSTQSPEGAWPCRHLDLGPLDSRTVRQYISVALSHPVGGTLLQSP